MPNVQPSPAVGSSRVFFPEAVLCRAQHSHADATSLSCRFYWSPLEAIHMKVFPALPRIQGSTSSVSCALNSFSEVLLAVHRVPSNLTVVIYPTKLLQLVIKPSLWDLLFHGVAPAVRCTRACERSRPEPACSREQTGFGKRGWLKNWTASWFIKIMEGFLQNVRWKIQTMEPLHTLFINKYIYNDVDLLATWLAVHTPAAIRWWGAHAPWAHILECHR
jgi:hypothetical protein